MTEDSTPDPLPTEAAVDAPKPARKRAPRRKPAETVTDAQVGAQVDVRGDAPMAATASEGGREEPAPASAPPSSQGDASSAERSNESLPAVGPSNEAPGDRPKRNRRRGRRGKEGRADAGPGQEPRPPRPPMEQRKTEVDPQALAQAGDAFALVTSEGYDEGVTATDEELRALEARAQAEPMAEGMAAADDASASTEVNELARASEGADAAQAASSEPGAEAGSDDRRVLAPQRDAPKLQKVLAQSGAGSRRDIEQWIVEGRVTVNGEAAHTGQRVSFGDRVAVDGKPVHIRIAPLPTRVIAYHKPVGEIVTHDDPQQRPTVFRKLPRLMHGKWQSVGRLDINTEGLLLFTNSGELANQLMHPRFGVEREYAVRVLGSLDTEARTKLLQGMDVDGQPAAFLSIDDGGGEGVNRWYRVTIAEGRHREVRRLFDSVGLAVSRLIRIRYGAVVLPRGLKRGVWIDLPEFDVKSLKRLVGLGDRVREEGGRERRGNNKPQRGRGGDRPPQHQGQGQGPAQGPGQGQGPRRNDRPPRPGPGPQDARGPARGNDRDRGRGDQRPPRGPGGPRGPREEGSIPNPLQQTYDKRAIREANRMPRREYGDDGPIPNPLQQTYDTRALREANRQPRRDYGDDGPIPNPLQQTFDKRQVQARGDGFVIDQRQQGRRSGPQGGGNGRQPDPMQTAVGYIGANAFHGKPARGRGRGGQGGGGGGGGGNGGGGGGRGRR